MRLDDFLVLGRTVPEESHRYGVRVCMAGYSEELGRLLRVYPLTIDNPLRARHQSVLELQRNPDDTRQESYKLKDAVMSIHTVSDKPVSTVQDIGTLAAKLAYSSIVEMNAKRLSLGFVQVDGVPQLRFLTREHCPQGPQLSLFEAFLHDLKVNKFLVPTDYPQIPYVQFKDAAGWHCLQLREWGTYEYLRKRDFRPDGLVQALQLDEHPQPTWYALVGNMAHQRNVWLVIYLVRHRQEERELFAFSHPVGNGNPTGLPQTSYHRIG